MILRHVALVSETQSISFSELGRVSAALQKQAVRDLGPVWNIQSTVDAFARLEDAVIGSADVGSEGGRRQQRNYEGECECTFGHFVSPM